MRRSRRPDSSPNPNDTRTAGLLDDGSLQAMDHMANWVRFADTKATILTAGLGVVVTMLMTNADVVMDALREGCAAAYVVGTLAGVSILAMIFTLFWLVRAILPQRGATNRATNRFAWPTLIGVSAQDLVRYTTSQPLGVDAWAQVVDLAVLADRKYDACRHAVRGFAVTLVVSVACLVVATAFVG